MEIPLVSNWETIYKPGTAQVYASGHANRAVIDKTMDELHDRGRVEWTRHHTPLSFPVFVIWKIDSDSNRKARMVVDIRVLNSITVPDAYPIPLQSDILTLLQGCNYISVVDCNKFFYQWWIRGDHRYHITICSHRGQKTFKVPIMGFRNSSAYVQRMINNILRPQHPFSYAYVDDIIIFSKTLEKYQQHLPEVFSALDDQNIALSSKKSCIGFRSVKLLGQKVDVLGLAIAEDKLKAIAHFKFLKTLAQLETYLGLTGYLRRYIPYSAQLSDPLQRRKTKLGKQLEKSGKARKREAAKTKVIEPTAEEPESFKILQKRFAQENLFHHFERNRQLYIDVDASMEHRVGVVIYHMKNEEDKGPKSIEPILFLSRMLNDAETRYWPTEMETVGPVWAVRKLRQLIEASSKPTIVYKDHRSIIGLAKQISLNSVSVKKLNLRHIRVSEYLRHFTLDVCYKHSPLNIIPDALSWLATLHPDSID